MIVSTFNARGLGGVVKRRRIRELIRNHRIEFLAIQETKLEEVSESLCFGLSGSQDCDWAHFPSEGRSGGILSIWSKSNNSHFFFHG
jgi:exonuclease III